MRILITLSLLIIGPMMSSFAEVVQVTPDGFHLYKLPSPHQARETSLRVLLPDNFDPGKSYKVLYVLPVHEDGLFRHGDGLVEVKKYNYHNTHQLICVAPAFTTKPWFADHDLNPQKQDESHFLKTVIPFVDANYPTQASSDGRLLIGFSKSGWGSIALILRNLELFGKAAGWDIGIRVDTGPIEEDDRAERIAREWGTVENFEANRISNLVKTRGKDLGDEPRLFYYSTEGVRAIGGVEIHRLLVENEIPHRYVMEPHRKHAWDTGWIPEAVTFLMK
jgi:hypothetical protein